eukprot:CAMPEP_0194515396 /NCGR_PEP_ID=MMETSP0253-20130528/48070_1 /TAXON_ID=2966 /ORGANISM="Noctiluca scintillans" /LENGTH=282 /DNA_ID=CAMNT_0039359143 /DNA_START=618 /DNA_END=1467 /DNA_ORIENTATION=-
MAVATCGRSFQISKVTVEVWHVLDDGRKPRQRLGVHSFAESRSQAAPDFSRKLAVLKEGEEVRSVELPIDENTPLQFIQKQRLKVVQGPRPKRIPTTSCKQSAKSAFHGCTSSQTFEATRSATTTTERQLAKVNITAVCSSSRSMYTAPNTMTCLQKNKELAMSVISRKTSSTDVERDAHLRGQHQQRFNRKFSSLNSSEIPRLMPEFSPSSTCPNTSVATFVKIFFVSASLSSRGSTSRELVGVVPCRLAELMKPFDFRALVALKLGGAEELTLPGTDSST